MYHMLILVCSWLVGTRLQSPAGEPEGGVRSHGRRERAERDECDADGAPVVRRGVYIRFMVLTN